MEKMMIEMLKLYLISQHKKEENKEFDFVIKQNQIYLYTLLRTLSHNEMDFLMITVNKNIKIKDYLQKHQLTENQYYSQQRKILRKLKRENNGKY